MRPVPLPDWVRNDPTVEGTAVFSAPDGDLTNPVVAPAEGFFGTINVEGVGPTQIVAAVLLLDDDDLAFIAAGARHLVLPWPGREMPVFLTPWLIGPAPDTAADDHPETDRG